MRMSNETILAAVASPLVQTVGEMNDWAVNTVRDHANVEGWSRDQAGTMVAEERRRIDGGSLSLQGYLQCRRTGSRWRLNRKIRRAVWALVATRRAFNNLCPEQGSR